MIKINEAWKQSNFKYLQDIPKANCANQLSKNSDDHLTQANEIISWNGMQYGCWTIGIITEKYLLNPDTNEHNIVLINSGDNFYEEPGELDGGALIYALYEISEEEISYRNNWQKFCNSIEELKNCFANKDQIYNLTDELYNLWLEENGYGSECKDQEIIAWFPVFFREKEFDIFSLEDKQKVY